MEIRKSVSELEKMAVNACRLISMDPERMGKHICIECSEELGEFLAKIPEELRAEYEKKLSAAANPDAQRAAMHFESMVNSYGQLKKALERLPEDMAAKIRAKVSQAVAGMVEEMSDDAS